MKTILVLMLCLFTSPVWATRDWDARETAIFEAVSDGDLETVRNLLSTGVDINVQNLMGGESLLHDAAWHGHRELTAFLISNGAHVDVKNDSKSTPLHWAAVKGYRDIAKLLISNGADVQWESTSGNTPLHKAAYYGYRDLVALLILNGARFDTQNHYKKTPLILAEEQGHTEIVDLFKKLQAILDLWVMEQPEYSSYIQWLPRELVEDLLQDFLLKQGVDL